MQQITRARMGKKMQAGVHYLLYQLFIIALAPLPPTIGPGQQYAHRQETINTTVPSPHEVQSQTSMLKEITAGVIQGSGLNRRQRGKCRPSRYNDAWQPARQVCRQYLPNHGPNSIDLSQCHNYIQINCAEQNQLFLI